MWTNGACSSLFAVVMPNHMRGSRGILSNNMDSWGHESLLRRKIPRKYLNVRLHMAWNFTTSTKCSFTSIIPEKLSSKACRPPVYFVHCTHWWCFIFSSGNFIIPMQSTFLWSPFNSYWFFNAWVFSLQKLSQYSAFARIFFICLTQQTCPISRHLLIAIFQFYHKGINPIFPSINGWTYAILYTLQKSSYPFL